MEQIIEKVKTFDYKEFSWREATNNDSGQSSAALFLCFGMGLALIFLTVIVGLLMVANAIHKIDVDFTAVFLFIGSTFGTIMMYAGVRISSNNKVKLEVKKPETIE